jgi:hypothetical protein
MTTTSYSRRAHVVVYMRRVGVFVMRSISYRFPMDNFEVYNLYK